ncbi:semaphorin-5A [Octopus sinensis]|uniref:Semaphorin-2A n=1 Tax=Octopus sinensis TaxID=2607531 RepID=A0A7E6EXF6_9MOLL|nr:semaphorin-5A [Octopus sinensis]
MLSLLVKSRTRLSPMKLQLHLALILFTFTFLHTVTSYSPGDYRYISYDDLLNNYKFHHKDLIGNVPLTIDKKNHQLLLGARNGIFRLSLANLTLTEYAEWMPSEATLDTCIQKGLPKDECHNFVRVLIIQHEQVLTCGTNAYSPMCCWRNVNSIKHVSQRINGKQKCPYSPRHNFTSIISEDGNFYTGSVVDIQARDYAISRVLGPLPILRTLRSNSKWLNEPNFVSSYEIESHIYFFFRETAVEYINCGKKVYSRVARICKTDRGGDSLLLENNWTTFLKSRINCSLPGEFPFYFNEIQHTFYSKEENLIYAVFGTGDNSIPGSAICIYDIHAFHRSFSGAFKYQMNANTAWMKMENPKADSQCPSPGSSSKRSFSNHISQVLLDAEKYQMMNDAVQPITNRPPFVGVGERWTHIIADTVYTLKGKFSVVFIGTLDGYVKKMIHIPRVNLSCILEEIRITPKGQNEPVTSIIKSREEKALYVVTSRTLIKIPFERCHRLKTKSMCLQARDPYCAWNKINKTCATPPVNQLETLFWLQDITSCPVLETPVDGQWSPWSQWLQCRIVGPDRLGDDCWCRTRTCDNPAPRLGGRDCVGDTVEVSNCTTHGGWTPWSAWTSCSQTCNSGVRSRTRTCGNPAPLHGGRDCEGSPKQEEYCPGNPRCPYSPINGQWSMWSSWAGCSERCYGGVQTRRRNCDNPPPKHKGLPCIGNEQEWRMCNKHNCDAKVKVVPWSDWVKTNTTRGGYFEQRFRFSCSAPVPDRHMIRAKHMKSQVRFCLNNGVCHNSDNKWSKWSSWTNCSSKCGGGLRYRKRNCLSSHPEVLAYCKGPQMEVMHCNMQPCHDSTGKVPWSLWSACQAEGIRYRYKICGKKAKHYGHCNGHNVEIVQCFTPEYDTSYVTSSNYPSFALIHLIAVAVIGFTIGALLTGTIMHHIHKCQTSRKVRITKQKNEKAQCNMNHAPFTLSSSSLSQASLVYLNNAPSCQPIMLPPPPPISNNINELNINEFSTLKRNCDLRTNLALNDL